MTPPIAPDSGDAPRISVVLACPGGDGDVGGALRALRRGTEGVASEVLVAHPAGRGGELHRRPGTGAVRRVEGPPDALVPDLWGAGLRAARGWAVAFTIPHVRADAGWAASLLAALEEGAAGAGGPILLAEGAGAFLRAVHLLRYSDFGGGRPSGPVEEIPGDNAAYRREALERAGVVGEDGFWDVEVHRRLRERGGRLAWVPEAGVRMTSTEGIGSFLRQRFRHGRRFGRYRTRELGTPVWRSLAAAPLVPAVLAGRALARARSRGEGWAASLPALPYLLLTASAWAAGEARGAAEVAADGDVDRGGGTG